MMKLKTFLQSWKLHEQNTQEPYMGNHLNLVSPDLYVYKSEAAVICSRSEQIEQQTLIYFMEALQGNYKQIL